MPSKKEYEQQSIHTLLRKSYYQKIRNLKNITIVDFLDRAIGRELNINNDSDEWYLQEIATKEKEIDGLKSLLTEKKNERDKFKIKEEKNLKYWNNFELYLQGNKIFNTSFINEECNTKLPKGSRKDFKVLQERYKNGKFGFEDFKKEVLNG